MMRWISFGGVCNARLEPLGRWVSMSLVTKMEWCGEGGTLVPPFDVLGVGDHGCMVSLEGELDEALAYFIGWCIC